MQRREFIASTALAGLMRNADMVKVGSSNGDDVLVLAFGTPINHSMSHEIQRGLLELGVRALVVQNCDVSLLFKRHVRMHNIRPRDLYCDGKRFEFPVFWAHPESGLVCHYEVDELGQLKCIPDVTTIVRRFDRVEWIQRVIPNV